MKIGILALQGAFAEHADICEALGARSLLVRAPEHLSGLSGLILPGGESTSMRLLAAQNGLHDALRDIAVRIPMWGVCAGLILMAARVDGETPFLGCMDIGVERNAYGRQQESFVANLIVDGLAEQARPLPGVFIRAPRIRDAGKSVAVLARCSGEPVAVRQGHFLGTAFHPELTSDFRMHEYFLHMCQ